MSTCHRTSIDCHRACEDEQKYKHNTKPLFCTDPGNIVGENLERIYKALPYKECSPDEYK